MIRRIALLLAAAAASFACEITTAPVLAPTVTGKFSSYNITHTACGAALVDAHLASGALPPGMELVFSKASNSIVVRGTPTTAGGYGFTIRLIGEEFERPTKGFVLQVNPPLQIVTPALASTTAATAYTDQVRVAGGSAPYTFSIVEGSLPGTLTLNPSTGAITGTSPNASSTFRVRVTDSSTPQQAAEFPYTIVIEPFRITTTANAPSGSVGTPYSFDIDSTQATSCMYLVLGSLPPGLSINLNGVISGTPTTPGRYNFTVRCTVETADWRSYQILINGAGAVTGDPPDAPWGVGYAYPLSVSGGVAPYTWAITAGELPFGLTLDPVSGVIYGTAGGESGGTTFTVTATDAAGRAYTGNLAVDTMYGFFALSANVLPAKVGVAGSGLPYFCYIPGGILPVCTYRIIGGTGTSQMSINASTGFVNYQFNSPGSYTPIILVSDALGNSDIDGSIPFVAVGNLGIQTKVVPNAKVGVAYSTTLVPENGAFTPLSWAISAGSLPGGLTLDTSTGVISGTPTGNQASFTFTVTVTDATNATASRTYQMGLSQTGVITTTTLAPATVGQPYSQTFTQNGASTELWSISSGTPPTGLGIFSNALQGTPTAAGTFTFRVRLSEEVTNDEKDFTMVVTNPLSISLTPATPLEATRGLSIGIPTITVTGGNGPFTFSVASGGLPPGISIKSTSPYGLQGVPYTAGTYAFSIGVTDADGRTATSASYTINVRENVEITTFTLPHPTNGVAYNQSISAIGGRGTITITRTSGTLPPGLTLSSAGVLAGTPTTNGSYSFVVEANDVDGRLDETSFLLNVRDPIVDTAPTALVNGSVLAAYSAPATTTGGSTNKTFSISAGNLPPLLLIGASNGVISNLPLVAGLYTFSVGVSDDEGRSSSKQHTILICCNLAITTPTLPNGTTGVNYSQPIGVTGAIGAVSFGVTAGALPTGLALVPNTGVISGTPTAAGTFNFTVTATDSASQVASQAYTVVIGQPLAITTLTLPNGTPGVNYSQAIGTSNAIGAVSFAVTSGSLPPGLGLGTSSGIVSGSPTTPGTYNFTITATDSGSQSAFRAYTVVIADTLTITTVSLPNGTTGVSYGQTIAASGGTAPLTFSLNAGTLPTNLAFNTNTGVLSGTPTVPGTYNFTIGAADSLNQFTTRAFTVIISDPLAITTATLPSGNVGTAYSQTVNITGGRAAFTFGAAGLPAGLTINPSTGAITGTPTAAGTANVTVTVTDADSRTASQNYTLLINANVSITPGTLPNGSVGTAYTQTLSMSGANGAAAWTVFSGALPPGITLAPTSGQLAGTPTQGGSFNFTVRATDQTPQSAQQSYTLVVNTAVSLAPSTLPAGNVNTPYNEAISMTNAVGAVAWTVSSGALPAGLTLNPTSGAISGTPTAAATYGFTIQGVDSINQTASLAYSVVINPAGAISPATLPDANVGLTYSQTLTLNNISTPPTWSINSGSLPAGLTLNPTTGVLSGTPTTAGPATFTVRANIPGAQFDQSYTLTVNGPLSVNPATLPNGIVAQPYSQSLTLQNSTGAVTWSLVTGTIPPGLTLGTSTGTLSGNPTTAGSYAFTVRGTGSLNQQAERQYSVTIASALAISPATIPNGVVGAPYRWDPLESTCRHASLSIL